MGISNNRALHSNMCWASWFCLVTKITLIEEANLIFIWLIKYLFYLLSLSMCSGKWGSFLLWCMVQKSCWKTERGISIELESYFTISKASFLVSPLSCHLAYYQPDLSFSCCIQIQEGRFQSLDQCLVREYRITLNGISKKVSNDFCEVNRHFKSLT